jgi:hypothetical protein
MHGEASLLLSRYATNVADRSLRQSCRRASAKEKPRFRDVRSGAARRGRNVMNSVAPLMTAPI